VAFTANFFMFLVSCPKIRQIIDTCNAPCYYYA
jgi:hypothetical protein